MRPVGISDVVAISWISQLIQLHDRQADAFLRTGRGSESGAMSEEARTGGPHGPPLSLTEGFADREARNTLSAFLHHTGTESDKQSWRVLA